MLLIQPYAPLSVTGKDDIQQLKRLASGVGWEFEPNAETTAGLRRIGIKTIRCINVDPLPGKFDKAGKFVISDEPNRLLSHLQTCREIGATPHIILATGLHPDLRVTEEDIPASQRGLMGNQVKTTVFGPKDWEKFQHYCQAYFQYVLVTQEFPQARFFGGRKVTMERWLVSETVSNAEYLFTKEGKIDDRCQLQCVDQGSYSIVDGLVDIGFAQPPSSVSLVVMTAAR